MKILGIDFGLRKIGLAIADTGSKLSEPLSVIRIKDNQAVVRRIRKICQQEEIVKIVIGLPESGIVKQIKDFGKELAEATHLPLVYQEEVLTTKDAVVKMIQAGKKKKKRRQQEDAIAAAILLEDYFESARKNV